MVKEAWVGPRPEKSSASPGFFFIPEYLIGTNK
jgi:hypothetical protein